MKEKFLVLASNIQRPGIEELLQFLDTSDFYEAPCSTRFHLCVPGGLVAHSINVYELAKLKATSYKLDIPGESLLIVALFHDLCKVNYYAIDDEPMTGAQAKYLNDLLARTRVVLPYEKDAITKGQASVLIPWLKAGDYSTIPELKPAYKVDDRFPMGHGEKSVIVVQQFMKLTLEEQLAIRWHMGPFTDGFFGSPLVARAYNAAGEITPLVTILFTADMEAAHLFERS